MERFYFIQHIWCNTDYDVAVFDNESDLKFYLESLSKKIEVYLGGGLQLEKFILFDLLDFTKPIDDLMKTALNHIDLDRECDHVIKYTKLDLNEVVRL